MTADKWERVIDDAHALSVDTVQFIGGEPTLHPELPRLVRYTHGGMRSSGRFRLRAVAHRPTATIVIRRGRPVDWAPHAERLASEVAHPMSRWRPVIAAIPRHVFVPRWWAGGAGCGSDVWELRDGPADEYGWARAAYGNRSLVTQVSTQHADHAEPGDRSAGMPTSSATLPGLIVQMLRHAHVYDGADVLDVGTGSGYGCAVLARRLGDQRVTSVDVGAYLTTAAAERVGWPRCDPVGAWSPRSATPP